MRTDDANVAKVQKMLQALGEAATAVLPEGTSLNIQPFTGGDSFQVYKAQIDALDNEISKAIVGGTMVTDNGSSRSQSEVHERNLDEKLAQADSRLVEFTVNDQLFPILEYWGYGISPKTDYFEFDRGSELTLKEHWDIVNAALQHYEIDQEWVGKTFDIPITGVRENTFPTDSFSAAKNYHELRDMTDALRDGDRIRSFEEFRQAVEEIDAKYNGNWLRTEYDQAIAASQCGARWNEFKRNAKAMPMLQYQAVMDSNTREDHARLNGVKKRVDDPFWDIYMPPNGWGCRCEVIQLPSSAAKETPSEKIIPPQVPKMFRANFGKRGMAFPAGHAYFKRLPQEYEYKLNETTREEVRRILDNAQEYQRLKDDKDYTGVDFGWGNGGLKATHKDHNFDKAKGIYEKTTRDVGFKNGHSVILESERGKGIGENYTEGLWDNLPFELASCESTKNNNNIVKGLKHCASKSDTSTAVLYFPKDNDIVKEDVERAINRYYGLRNTLGNGFKDFESIFVVCGDKTYQMR